jgi:hypothetical protein
MQVLYGKVSFRKSGKWVVADTDRNGQKKTPGDKSPGV